MKKLFCTVFILFALLPLALQLIIGPAQLFSAYQQWSVEALNNAAASTHATLPDTIEAVVDNKSSVAIIENSNCSFPVKMSIIGGGLAILFLMYCYKVSPIVIRRAVQINIILIFECLLQYIDAGVKLHGTADVFFNTVIMTGLLPLHHYLEPRCAEFLLMHPFHPSLKASIITILKTILCFWRS